MKRIKHVSLDEVSPGISLALDVVDPAGNVLLRKDSLLTDANIAKLRNKKIASISICIEDNISNEQEYERVTRLLEHQFRKMIDDPDMQKLKSIILEYRTRTLPHRRNG